MSSHTLFVFFIFLVLSPAQVTIKDLDNEQARIYDPVFCRVAVSIVLCHRQRHPIVMTIDFVDGLVMSARETTRLFIFEQESKS